jgi:hypothetical protein
MDIKKPELLHIVWEQMGRRVSSNCEEEVLHDLLMYRVKELPESPVNQKREVIIDYINKHRSRLSLYCDGNCYNHHDGVVLFCYKQLIKEQEGG